MALRHVVLAALFALVGCKKPANHDAPGSNAQEATSGDTKAAGATPTPTAAGSKQAGPGFTVVATAPARNTKEKLADDQPEDDVYTYVNTGKEIDQVRIHPVRADQDGMQAASLVRDKLVFTAAVKLNEDDVDDGTMKGYDLTYKTEDEHLFVRSKIVTDGKNVYHVRAVYPKKDREDAANAFVDSFAFSN
ncbi:MAG TPA: hypothetical protein VGM39_26050 [Kofleriaceae bacterium]|jgi:hypothetical protein